MPTEYTNGDGDETVYTYSTSTGDLLQSERYANGTCSDNTGQNTAIGGDPITSYVYTPYVNESSTPGGLVSSTTNPDGDVTAYSYDLAGNTTAADQGQMVAFSAGAAVFNNLPQSPGLTRTFEVYVNSTSAPASGYTTITDSDSGSPTFSFSGSAATPLGSGWYLLGTVTLGAGDLSSTVTVNYSDSGTGVSQVTLLEQTSATVYDSQENPLSVTDALGRVSASTYDNLGLPIAGSQGQVLPLTAGAAAFNNLPQSPGQARTYAVYVQSTGTPVSGDCSISDSNSGSPAFTFSGSSTTPFGSGWYLLGTVTVAAGDTSSTVTVHYSGSGVSQVALLEQTSNTVYDAASNVLSQTDGLNDVTTFAYNDVEQETSTSQGQIVPLVSGSAPLANLPQTPGVARIFTIYVQASSTPSGSDTTITENGSDTPAFTPGVSSTTPLGAGWYELGTVTLAAADASSALTVGYSGGGVSEVCLVQPMSGVSYTPTGLVSSQTNGNGDISVSSYDSDGDPTSASQGQTAAMVSGSAAFNNLAQTPGLSRTYTIYVQSSTAPVSGYTTITDNQSGSPAFTFSGSSATPLGAGWYELGTVVLAAGDTSSTVTVGYSGSGVSQACALGADLGRGLRRPRAGHRRHRCAGKHDRLYVPVRRRHRRGNDPAGPDPGCGLRLGDVQQRGPGPRRGADVHDLRAIEHGPRQWGHHDHRQQFRRPGVQLQRLGDDPVGQRLV